MKEVDEMVVRDIIYSQVFRWLIKLANIKFEIIRTQEFYQNPQRAGKKELNLVSWNDREPKYDLRDWDPENEKMGKGFTLTEEELKKLKELQLRA